MGLIDSLMSLKDSYILSSGLAKNALAKMVIEKSIIAIDECIDIVKQHNGWVSVDEQLPPINKDVLVYVADGFCGAYIDISYYKGNGIAPWHDIYINESVTHWCEIPQPPSEVQDDPTLHH